MHALSLVEALRLAAGAQLLLLALLVWRDHGRTRAGRPTVLLALTAVCYVLAPLLLGRQAPPLVTLAVLLGALAVPITFWIATRAHFDDDFRPRPVHAVLLAGLVALRYGSWLLGDGATANRTVWAAGSSIIATAVAVAVVGDALRRIHAGGRTDLVAPRLRLRRFVLVVAGGFILVVLVGELALRGTSLLERVAGLAEAAGVFVLAFALSALLLRLEPLFVRGATGREAPGATPELKARLEEWIQQEPAFRKAGLTIGELARDLGEQEYRVRQLINAELGFRNFNAFLNHFRIEEARALLADPAERSLGIAEIAFRLGYASLGPFNRAFKERTSQTPTEFRKSARG